MTPPDSGEREVRREQLEILRYAAKLRARQDTRSGVEVVPEMLVRLVDEVEHHRAHCPSRDLAQRILAALDDHGCEYDAQCRALASELRAIVERKT